MPTSRPPLLALAFAACATVATFDVAGARAEPPPSSGSDGSAPVAPSVVPPDASLPASLSLDEALRILNARGLDLLLQDATIASAQADAQTAAALANPQLSFSSGPLLNYDTSAPSCLSGCSRQVLNVGIGDNGLVFDSIFGKRGLRVDVARAAIAAARLSRADAKRNLEFQVKQAYAQIALQAETLDLDLEIQKSLEASLRIGRAQYPRQIDEGALARLEVQKLEGDQAIASDIQSLRQAKIALAFLLGARRVVNDFEIDRSVLKFRVPSALASVQADDLLHRALAARPDVGALGYQRMRADASFVLARRSQVPAIDLGLQWSSWGVGQSAVTPPAISGQIQANIPIFYQQQGEIRRARADLATQSLQYTKTLALVASDIQKGIASFNANKELIGRMEDRLLERAKTARDTVEKQYRGGNLTLSDFLDAQRTYIATRQEYLNDLMSYWTSVFALEQAVNGELRR